MNLSSLELSRLRYPTMLVGFLALLLAILGGVRRIGYDLFWVPVHLTFQHGGLMVSAFLGTVISMERAVAVKIPGSLLVPILTAAGTVLLLINQVPSLGIFLIALSSLGATGLFLYIHSLQPALHNRVLVAGGLCWFAGNVLWWYHVPVHGLVSWWMGLLVFVVAAERLELNRLAQFSLLQKGIFLGGVTIGALGMAAHSLDYAGARLTGLGFLLLAGWLVKNDMVRKMLFMGGERGYTGWCLFTGYFWLALGGTFMILFPDANSGFLYDAYLHSVLVGFVFTMIFGHAFIIMPGVLDVDLSYHAGFYGPLVLLEGTLALRVAGDLLYSSTLRQWGGLGNGLVIVLFLIMLVETIVRNKLTLDEF